MRATINGITVEGTPQEIAEYERIRELQKDNHTAQEEYQRIFGGTIGARQDNDQLAQQRAMQHQQMLTTRDQQNWRVDNDATMVDRGINQPMSDMQKVGQAISALTSNGIV